MNQQLRLLTCNLQLSENYDHKDPLATSVISESWAHMEGGCLAGKEANQYGFIGLV